MIVLQWRMGLSRTEFSGMPSYNHHCTVLTLCTVKSLQGQPHVSSIKWDKYCIITKTWYANHAWVIQLVFFLFFSHNLTCRAHWSSVGERFRRRLLLSSTKTHSRDLDQLKLSAGETWDTMFPSLLLYQVGEQPISYGMRAGSSRRAGYLFKELTMNQEAMFR